MSSDQKIPILQDLISKGQNLSDEQIQIDFQDQPDMNPQQWEEPLLDQEISVKEALEADPMLDQGRNKPSQSVTEREIRSILDRHMQNALAEIMQTLKTK